MMVGTDIKIEDYLLHTGHKPVRTTGKYLFYMSPLRNENNASFLVRRTDGKWSDPGVKVSGRETRKWHSILDYVMEEQNCDIRQANKILTGADMTHSKEPRITQTLPSIDIINEQDLNDKRLIKYIQSRNINIDIAKIYTKEIDVVFPNSERAAGKVFKYIGFKSEKGSWECRNEGFKVSSSPKYYTRILGTSTTHRNNVFEGFFDFLSALTYWRKESLKNDTYVLNSLVNIIYIEDYLKDADLNYMFLDNDESASDKMVELYDKYIQMEDMRSIYKGHNDFNDFICGKVMV